MCVVVVVSLIRHEHEHKIQEHLERVLLKKKYIYIKEHTK